MQAVEQALASTPPTVPPPTNLTPTSYASAAAKPPANPTAPSQHPPAFTDFFRPQASPKPPKVIYESYTSVFVRVFPTRAARTASATQRLQSFRIKQQELKIYDLVSKTRSVGLSLFHLLVPTIHLDTVSSALKTNNFSVTTNIDLEQLPDHLQASISQMNAQGASVHKQKYLSRTKTIAATFLSTISPHHMPMRQAFLTCFPTLSADIVTDAQTFRKQQRKPTFSSHPIPPQDSPNANNSMNDDADI